MYTRSVAYQKKRCMSRVLRDYQELCESPVANVAAAPVDDDLLTWHINIRTAETSKASFHFQMTIPQTYPLNGPTLRALTPFPHPNITPSYAGGAFHHAVCLAILGPRVADQPGLGWRCAYSIASVLRQLLVLLGDRELFVETPEITMATAEEAAMQFKCTKCGHGNDGDVVPAYPDPEAVANVAHCRVVRTPIRAKLEDLGAIVPSFPSKPKSAPAPAPVPATKPVDGGSVSSQSVDGDEEEETKAAPAASVPSTKTLPASASVSAPLSSPAPAPKKKTNQWIVVQNKRRSKINTNKSKKKSNNHKTAAAANSNTFQPLTAAHKYTRLECAQCHDKLQVMAFTATQLSRGSARRCKSCVGSPTSSSSSGSGSGSGTSSSSSKPVTMTKAALRNFRRREKKRLAVSVGSFRTTEVTPKAVVQEAPAEPVPAPEPTTTTTITTAEVVEDEANAGAGVGPRDDDGWSDSDGEHDTAGAGANAGAGQAPSTTTSPTTTTTWQDTVRSVLGPDALDFLKPATVSAVSAPTSSRTRQTAVSREESAARFDARKRAGLLSKVPFALLLRTVTKLPVADIASLSSTCKYLSFVSSDGAIWHRLFRSAYPASKLTYEKMSDAKHAFMLEMNDASTQMTCAFSKVPYTETVLGLPVNAPDVNPRTRRHQYMLPQHEMLSYEAFCDGYRFTSTSHSAFTHWLPLYLSRDHFRRAIRSRIPAAIKSLAFPDGPEDRPFSSLQVLDVLPAMMNTTAVLIADKGLAVCSNVLDTYCRLHRLFLELTWTWSGLRREIDARLRRAITSWSSFTKKNYPSLGDLLPLLSVCETVSWDQLCGPLLTEVLTRNHLWMVKNDPSLASGFSSDTADLKRLDAAFKATKVSLRIVMLNAVFVNSVAKPRGVSLRTVANRHDLLMGVPALPVKQAFTRRIKALLEVDSWPGFFAMLGRTCPRPTQLQAKLVDAEKNSLSRGYHSASTNFSRIHSSGVSQVLRAGESFKGAPLNLNHVSLTETWRWVGGKTQFLDASCIMVGFNGRVAQTVDYSSSLAAAHTGRGPAVRHSGDVMNHAARLGTHKLDIYLQSIAPHIKSLYITMSAWWTTLKDHFRAPTVGFVDNATGLELCKYVFESQKPDPEAQAIVMCRIHRDTPTSTKWTVTAVGEVGQGHAGDYTLLHELVTGLEASAE